MADQLDNYRERIYDSGQGHIDTRGFDRFAPSSTAAAEDVRDYLHSMLLEIDQINAKVSNGEVVIQEASGPSRLRSH